MHEIEKKIIMAMYLYNMYTCYIFYKTHRNVVPRAHIVFGFFAKTYIYAVRKYAF